MDETLLLAAICGSRRAYENALRIGLASGDFTETGRVILDSATDQYTRDADAKAVSRDILRSQVERKFGAGSMADSVVEFVDRFPRDVSKVNVVEEYRLLRLARTSTTLATLLASGNHGEATQEALVQYATLAAGEEGEEFKERLTLDDFDDDRSARIALYPKELNSYIKGGVHRGHNITVNGRPNSAKTMFALNNAACLAKNGYRVLYVANEEPDQDITLRLLSRMAKMDIDKLDTREGRAEAMKRAGSAYKKNWILLHKANVTARDIRRQCARLRPDVVIVDQLKNVYVAEDNRALQLDKLARQVREIGIEFKCVTISVTQAGESAEGKLILGMTDVEWSNTGIPGAADLMIGVGLNDEFMSENKRMLTICKNKIKNQHGSFPVWIDAQRTLISGRAL